MGKLPYIYVNIMGEYPSEWIIYVDKPFIFNVYIQFFICSLAFKSNPFVCHSGSKVRDKFGIFMNYINDGNALSSKSLYMNNLAASLSNILIKQNIL